MRRLYIGMDTANFDMFLKIGDLRRFSEEYTNISTIDLNFDLRNF